MRIHGAKYNSKPDKNVHKSQLFTNERLLKLHNLRMFSLRISENKRKNENFSSVQKISLEEMFNVHDPDPDPVLDPDPFLQGKSRTRIWILIRIKWILSTSCASMCLYVLLNLCF